MAQSLGNGVTAITGDGGKTTYWAVGTATAAVDHVRVILSGGGSVKVPTVDCGGPRFFAFAVPKGHRFLRVDYYSASRKLIASQTAKQIYS